MSSMSPADGDHLSADDSGAPIQLVARSYDDPDAQMLVKALYGEQLDTYGFADSPEAEVASDYVEPCGLLLVACTSSGQPVGCGGYRTYDQGARVAEVRKMFVTPDYRGHGLARRILSQLERQAVELGARRIVLETGALNGAAIRLYLATGYRPIPSYVPGRRSTNRAFAKTLQGKM